MTMDRTERELREDRRDLRHILDRLMITTEDLIVPEEAFANIYTLRVTGAAIIRARELMYAIPVEP